MIPGVHGGHIAAAEAEKRRRMMHEEEERMTKYSQEELHEDWEFKIVRADTPIFRKPEMFQQMLQEEAISGWQLVEKLDDMRVRLKRPAGARKRDAMLPEGIDPYRTRFGRSSRAALMIVVLLGLVVTVAAGLIPLFMSEDLPVISITVGIGVIILVIAVILLAFARMRR